MKTAEERQQKEAELHAKLDNKKAGRDQQKDTKRQQKADKAFERSLAGNAAEAYARGDTFFQVQLDGDQHLNELGDVEAQGWRLEHAGWVTHPTKGTLSTTETWHIISMYLFRRTPLSQH